MNLSARNDVSHNSKSDAGMAGDLGAAEETLRLLAKLPAPEGLEDRVMAGLKSAPRGARVLSWPAALRPGGSWMRAAAAAAIVFVVAGGGWGIYSRVGPPQAPRAIALPPHAGGGFSTAGAMRTPETVKGPVVTKAGVAQAVPQKPEEAEPLKKTSAGIVPTGNDRAAAPKKVNAESKLTAVQ